MTTKCHEVDNEHMMTSGKRIGILPRQLVGSEVNLETTFW